MQKLLASLITDDEFERIQLVLKEPNIFSALAVHRMEIRHSNFIGYLIDPNENHGLKDLVLKKVLRGIFNSCKNNNRSIFDADYLDYSNVEIRREWRNIDILIILSKDIIVIENKIDSVDHSNQLDRYKEIAEKSFSGKIITYVYLTPFGDDPKDELSKTNYINYSYKEISKIIETIISLYRNSLSEKIYFYLSDYLTVLKRELLMEDTLNEDARKVYIKHKKALDFIFENIPNPINEILYPAFEKTLIESGYLIGSRGSRYIRFTTDALDKLLPKEGSGWKNKEIFLFELEFVKDEVKFSATVSPSKLKSPNSEKMREAIRDAIKNSSLEKSESLATKLIPLVKKNNYKFFSIDSIGEQSTIDISNKVLEVIDSIKPIVDEISGLIINDKNVNEISELIMKNVKMAANRTNS